MHGLLLAESEFYRVHRDDDLFIVRFHGYWNDTVASEFVSRFRWLVEISNLRSWGALADLREFDGATSAALLMGEETLDWMVAHGQVVGAHVINSGVTSESLRQLQELQRERIAFDTFISYEIAIPWVQAKVRQLG